MPEFTIGFLGRFRFTPRMRDCFDTLVSRYACDGLHLRIAVELGSKQQLLMAERVLALRRILPGLRLLAVVAQTQENACRRPASLSARRRREILDAADEYELLPGNAGEFLRVVQVNRLFAARCDLIVYSAYLAPKYATDNLRLQVASRPDPPRVRCLSDEFPVRRPVSFEPELALAESIGYLRRNRCRIMSGDLPPELLAKWLAACDEPRLYPRLASLEDVADIFRLDGAPDCDYLLFKVFAYAYALHRDLWVLPCRGCGADAVASVLYRQFRRLLELVAEAREAGVDIGNHDLLDFARYDSLLKICALPQRLGELSGRLI